MSSAFIQTNQGQVTTHPPLQFYAGDDWEIEVTCTDGDGNLIDLDGADLAWLLNDVDDNFNVLKLTVGDGIVLEENVSGELLAGQCLITVDSAKTAALAPGFYKDQLTIVKDGLTETQFRGRIEVLAKLAEPTSGD